MGLLDSFMPGETGGIMNQPQGGMQGLLGNPLLQMGLGILGNNTGHYGAFGPAVGQGAMQGIQASQQYAQQQQLQALRAMQITKAKKEMEDDEALGKQLGTYGQPNSQGPSVTSTTNVPAPQGTDAPNFNTIPQTTTTPGAQTFDQSKWMMGLLPYMDHKDAVTLLTQKHKSTFVDTGNGLMQVDEYGNPTGVTVPKGATADAVLNAQVGMRNHDTASGDAKLSSATSRENNAATTGTTIRGQNMTQQTELKKLDPFGLNTPQVSGPKTATLADIADTAKSTGKTTAEVTKDLKAKGWKIGN